MTIAVCIGTYGTEQWSNLAHTRAIPSAQNQTSPAHDIIHWHAETLQEARNGAAERARSDWLCFLDADDELDAGYLAAMTEALPDRDALLQPATLGVHPDGHEDPYPALIPPKPLLEGNYMVIGTLIRRTQFERLGGFDDWPLYEDWDLWIRARTDGAALISVPDAIYRVHVNSGGRNSSPRPAQLDTYAAIRRRHLGRVQR